MTHPNQGSTGPEAWIPARRAVERVLRPLERFLRVEAAGGVVLLVAAVVALVWANSPLADSYERFWHAPVTLGAGSFTSTTSVRFWVNDGLMVVFFFVVGLEIRREIHQGELSDLRRAALPVAAALGGMLVPALIFLALNSGQPSQRGWGVPMATDIAFAVGVLALLGKRVPAALRVLLLAIAIIDDMGAIVVIAIFYSSGVSVGGLLLGSGGVALVLVLQRLGVRHPAAYVLPGVLLWLGCLRAGVHPTIAGVILGLLTPARAWFGELGFLVAVRHAVDEAVAPAVRLQTALHPWVAFIIMPLFALANAGVNLGQVQWEAAAMRPAVLGVVLGLVVGKPLGILLVGLLAVRLRVAVAPAGMTWRGLAVVGFVAGIGFTMAIFIADLAFAKSPLLGGAKVAILVASVVAGLITVIGGRFLLRGTPKPRGAAT